METKFCRDCRWCWAPGWFSRRSPKCLHPDTNKGRNVYLVSGRAQDARTADLARSGVYGLPCGPEGKLWERHDRFTDIPPG